MLRYLSVCSGIEAASVAWEPLGWKPVAFAEIEAFPSAVLAHHYPHVPNWGDITKFEEWPDANFDVLCGGTPCQSFSVAGLRKGLDDPRGNLMLTYLALAARYRPRWLVWENVPGVLSSNGGRDFGTFLGGVGELGYGFAYRVLDAQHFGVPQRRRRVFVVGCLGDWRAAAAVLFESESLRGDSPPRRETGQGIAADVAPSIRSSGPGLERTGDSRGQDPVVAVSPTLRAGGNKTGGDRPPGTDVDTVDSLLVAFGGNNTTGPMDEGQTMIAHSLRAEGFDASEDGTGRGTPLVPVAFDCKGTEVQFSEDGTHPTLRSMSYSGSHANAGGHAAVAVPPIGWSEELTAHENCAGTIQRGGDGGRHDGVMTDAMLVRRLTPRECERLQGFPDDYTAIPYRSKPAADGPRYKALGNSWAVPCARWIGERIQMMEEIRQTLKETA